MDRRRFVNALGAVPLLAAMPRAGEPSEDVPEKLKDTTYQDIKGFNYVPSYAATIWDVIDLFDAEVWDREFGYSKRFHSNALRIWCDYISFQKDGKHFLKCWEKALALAETHGLKLKITLANRWTDSTWTYGQLDFAVTLRGEASDEYRNYLRTFVGTFKNHPQVLMWDICNEPFFPLWNPESDGGVLHTLLKEQELRFWRSVIETIRSASPSQPITIGVHQLLDWTPEAIFDLVDVISCHPYAGWWDGARDFKNICDYYIRVANQRSKPLICSETCQGSKNNETRTQIIQVCLHELEKRRIGWLAWQLMAGKIVTARWDRTDKNCRPGDDSVMYFVEKDGRTRPGHEEKEWRNWS
jgi:endo-1,4-beta-mannosidase